MSKNRANKLSEQDRELLETLGKFSIRARHSSWDSNNHHNDIEAVGLLREISSQITQFEYSLLMEGWSQYRLSGSDSSLNQGIDVITTRLQEGSETY